MTRLWIIGLLLLGVALFAEADKHMQRRASDAIRHISSQLNSRHLKNKREVAGNSFLEASKKLSGTLHRRSANNIRTLNIRETDDGNTLKHMAAVMAHSKRALGARTKIMKARSFDNHAPIHKAAKRASDKLRVAREKHVMALRRSLKPQDVQSPLAHIRRSFSKIHHAMRK